MCSAGSKEAFTNARKRLEFFSRYLMRWSMNRTQCLAEPSFVAV
jgi:hypothetical protein